CQAQQCGAQYGTILANSRFGFRVHTGILSMQARQSLEIRQQQSLALTPQLQQSIRFLQLSTHDLDQEISQALMENPLLEREEDFSADVETVLPSQEGAEPAELPSLADWPSRSRSRE